MSLHVGTIHVATVISLHGQYNWKTISSTGNFSSARYWVCKISHIGLAGGYVEYPFIEKVSKNETTLNRFNMIVSTIQISENFNRLSYFTKWNWIQYLHYENLKRGFEVKFVSFNLHNPPWLFGEKMKSLGCF